VTVIIEFQVPIDQVGLGAVVESAPAVSLELEPVIPAVVDGTVFVRVDTAESDGVERTLRGQPAVRAVEHLGREDDRVLYQLDWEGDSTPLFDELIDPDAAVLQGRLENGVWTFQVRFPTQEQASAFHEDCMSAGIDLTISRVIDATGSSRDTPLTEAQREALLLAFTEGYWDVPRQTTLVDLGEQLGVSDTAVSQRLRRAVAALIEDSLADAVEVDTDGGSLTTEPE
jgi:predicted DNA binding protein